MNLQLINFVKTEDSVTASIAKRFDGGSVSSILARSKIVHDPTTIERNVWVMGADEAAKGVLVWDSMSGQRLQSMRLPSPCLDIEVIESNTERVRVAVLTDKHVSIFERRA